jgi:hypothetical protein
MNRIQSDGDNTLAGWSNFECFRAFSEEVCTTEAQCGVIHMTETFTFLRFNFYFILGALRVSAVQSPSSDSNESLKSQQPRRLRALRQSGIASAISG